MRQYMLKEPLHGIPQNFGISLVPHDAGMKRLIIRPGAIGDCIVSLPALEFLCASASYCEIWASAPNVPIIRFGDAVRPISSTGLDVLGIPGYPPPEATVEALRCFGSIVSWYGANRPEFRDAVRSLGLPFEFLPALPVGGCGLHASDFYLQQVGAKPGGAPKIVADSERRNTAVIHPFSGSMRKNWPLDGYLELSRELSQRLAVEWTAGPEEPLENATRFDDLFTLARWLAGARVFIGNDSGISHLAAAAGIPVIALFGPTDPAIWAPRGPWVRVISWLGRERVDVLRDVESALDGLC